MVREVNLSESVANNLCWINGMCKHRHPNHQALPFDRQVTVQRADGHTVANCTNLTLKKNVDATDFSNISDTLNYVIVK